MSIKNNKKASFVIVFIVYVLASVIGVFIFNALNYDLWLNLLIADVCATIITFVFSLIFTNASVYDPYWSVQPLVICVGLLLSGTSLMAIIMVACVCAWGVRLTANWAYTFHGLNHQDWRYTMLKEKTGAFYPLINFLGIHLFPTIVVYTCVLPVVYAIVLGIPTTALGILGCLISVSAIALQTVSDFQMQSYRKSKTEPFISVGLWKYSRHPNYLGEILMWWGMALAFVLTVRPMWYLAFGALLNTVMFLVVSIPMADRRQSKKQGFDEYKSHTRMLLPIKK